MWCHTAALILLLQAIAVVSQRSTERSDLQIVASTEEPHRGDIITVTCRTRQTDPVPQIIMSRALGEEVQVIATNGIIREDFRDRFSATVTKAFDGRFQVSLSIYGEQSVILILVFVVI